MDKTAKVRLIALAILSVVAIFASYFAYKEDRRGILTVVFLDIGQGDSVFIDSPTGRQMLIDGGPGRSVLRELSKTMPFYDRSIDVVVATHPDADHIGGLNDVFEKYKVSVFVEPGVEGETSMYSELKKRVEKESSKIIEAKRGMTIDLGGGAKLEILFPDRDPEGMETNTASIVSRLVYGENEFILTGDSPKNIEEYIVSLEKLECQSPPAACGILKGDVLKAGHHGSKTSTSEIFLSAVSPEYTVISAGKDNRYGHPHKEVLDILNEFKTKVLRTDEQGRAIFKSDGQSLELKLREPR
jgi:competence protein ComEC